MVLIMNNKIINLHVLTDFNLPLEREVNESFKVSTNKISNFISSLNGFSMLINPFNPKALILNNKYKMIVLTIKENKLNWKDFDIYHLKTNKKERLFL